MGPCILISAPDEDEWLIAHQGSCTYWIGCWVTPTASLDMIKGKSAPLLGNEL